MKMKFFALISLAVLLNPSLSFADQTLFSGQTNEGELCELIVTKEDDLYEYFTLTIGTESYTFFNKAVESILAEETIFGLFHKDGDVNNPIIGAPIFAMGTYVDVQFIADYDEQTKEITRLRTIQIYKFAMIATVETGSTRLDCYRH